MTTSKFSKFHRPNRSVRVTISERDLDILGAVLRYRFSPTSELVRLVGGNEDVTQRRLRKLWEWELVNRFAFPGFRTQSEFIYYLDNRQSLEALVRHGRLPELPQHVDGDLRSNREADYAGAVLRGQHMQLGFLQHSLMISRLHFMLEQAAKQSDGRVSLELWQQGGQIAKRKVKLPKMRAGAGKGETAWKETGDTETVPLEPDALFTLRLHKHNALAHFLYEADRGTMTISDMLRKLRAYYYLIKKQQRNLDAFGIHPVRAVLIEVPTEARAKRLMGLVNHPLVAGPGKRTGLFWFTISPLFRDVPTDRGGRPLPAYLDHPEIVLDRIWALPDRIMRALADLENSPAAEPVSPTG